MSITLEIFESRLKVPGSESDFLWRNFPLRQGYRFVSSYVTLVCGPGFLPKCSPSKSIDCLPSSKLVGHKLVVRICMRKNDSDFIYGPISNLLNCFLLLLFVFFTLKIISKVVCYA